MNAFAWRRSLPPFLLGMSLAATGEITAGLLLYDGPGLIRALSVLLAVLLVALGLGILRGRAVVGTGTQGSAPGERRLWIHALLAAVGGMIFAASWELLAGFGATALSQATGLAVLGALPFYTGGAVLGMISAAEATKPGCAYPGVAAPLGGAAGVLGVGFLLFPATSPTTMLFLCVLFVGLGAQIHMSTVETSEERRNEETISAQ